MLVMTRQWRVRSRDPARPRPYRVAWGGAEAPGHAGDPKAEVMPQTQKATCSRRFRQPFMDGQVI